MSEQTPTATGVDEGEVTAFLQKVVADAAAVACATTVSLGDRLGIYTALAKAGPVTPGQLAERTGLSERHLREWLAAQVTSGYVEYDPADRTYSMPPAHAAVLADPDSPTYFAGFFTVAQGIAATEEALAEAYRTGGGIGWDAHPQALSAGVARFRRTTYLHGMVQDWLPSLDGVVQKLRTGARVADIGCGFGYSTIIMAQAYPNSAFVGFDYHVESIAAARKLAVEAGVVDRVSFTVSTASDFPGTGYDLITSYDCVHDMGDPGGVALQVRQALAADGTWLIVEPNLPGELTELIAHPYGRLFAGTSATVCLPSALAQRGDYALGNHAGEEALRRIVTGAGFNRWRRTTETPINAIYEARP
ncbi:MAG TPA: methyltransferase domain-containing protein [Nocardioidaceae bacterium]|nr:methyltransferase domain-containing protein [Nocardioidaceae bacterium]